MAGSRDLTNSGSLGRLSGTPANGGVSEGPATIAGARETTHFPTHHAPSSQDASSCAFERQVPLHQADTVNLSGRRAGRQRG